MKFAKRTMMTYSSPRRDNHSPHSSGLDRGCVSIGAGFLWLFFSFAVTASVPSSKQVLGTDRPSLFHLVRFFFTLLYLV